MGVFGRVDSRWGFGLIFVEDAGFGGDVSRKAHLPGAKAVQDEKQRHHISSGHFYIFLDLIPDAILT